MTRLLTRAFDLFCYAVLITMVLLPFLTGMEPQEFWSW